jgi:hypothetical protein
VLVYNGFVWVLRLVVKVGEMSPLDCGSSSVGEIDVLRLRPVDGCRLFDRKCIHPGGHLNNETVSLKENVLHKGVRATKTNKAMWRRCPNKGVS